MNIFQHVQCRRDNSEIISELPTVADKILFQFQTRLHAKQNTEIIWKFWKLFQRFISHVTTISGYM